MSKSKVYNIDLWEENPLTVPTIQLDSDRTIRFKITANKEDYDLSFKSVRYFIQKEDGKIVFNDCDIVDEIVEAKLTNQALYYTGTVPMQLLIYSPTGVEKTFVIYIYISESIVNDLAEESENEINVFQDVYKAIETLDKTVFVINDEVVKLADHNHDTLYAGISHSHKEYSEIDHTHSEYAETEHTHSNYSQEGHTHSEYAEVKHNHSEYAPIDHTHENMGGSSSVNTNAMFPSEASALIQGDYKYVLDKDITIEPNGSMQVPFKKAFLGKSAKGYSNYQYYKDGVSEREFTDDIVEAGKYNIGYALFFGDKPEEATKDSLSIQIGIFEEFTSTANLGSLAYFGGATVDMRDKVDITTGKKYILNFKNRDTVYPVVLKKGTYIYLQNRTTLSNIHEHTGYSPTSHTHSEYVNSRILTTAEYEALTTEEKNNGVMYFVY